MGWVLVGPELNSCLYLGIQKQMQNYSVVNMFIVHSWWLDIETPFSGSNRKYGTYIDTSNIVLDEGGGEALPARFFTSCQEGVTLAIVIKSQSIGWYDSPTIYCHNDPTFIVYHMFYSRCYMKLIWSIWPLLLFPWYILKVMPRIFGINGKIKLS